MELEFEQLSLGQISTLRDTLSDKVYEDHLGIYDFSNSWDELKGMTKKQYGYILFLLNTHKWFKLKQVLDTLKIKKY